MNLNEEQKAKLLELLASKNEAGFPTDREIATQVGCSLDLVRYYRRKKKPGPKPRAEHTATSVIGMNGADGHYLVISTAELEDYQALGWEQIAIGSGYALVRMR